MGTHHPIRKAVTPEIPDKLYFRIGDVARLCEVPAYVLRFWETEFPQLKPNKGGTGQRLYRKRDVETALRIKSLLYDQGYTIPGARQVLKGEAAKPAEGKVAAMRPTAPAVAVVEPSAESPAPTLAGLRRDQKLREIRNDMAALLASLSTDAPVSRRESKVQTMRPRLAVKRPAAPQLPLDGELF